MNSLPLQYSEYGEIDIDTPENKKKRNRTYKNKKRYNAKVKDFLKTIYFVNLLQFSPKIKKFFLLQMILLFWETHD